MIKLNSLEEIEEFIKNNDFSFLYFGDETCGVCMALLPKISKVLKEYPNIKAAYIEIDDVKLAMERYSIFTIPVVLLYVEEKETIREARFISVNDVEEKVKRIATIYK
ncbi:thioredoxin family protein [Clostridium algidicarnis]|uniref:thioredoxin family protein n=1 Tax=Clostridium algidicarnis TaxID=37659 RepID=UPI00049542DC|nr:thioredoxin family protein [Clostridium algidicarnis]